MEKFVLCTNNSNYLKLDKGKVICKQVISHS